MEYRKGYKYQLAKDEVFKTSFAPVKNIITKRIHLLSDGTLIVYEGYAWDGATFVVDRKTNIRASCGHDALYELMRKEKLHYVLWQKADECYAMWLRGAGAWDITVAIDSIGLAAAGGRAALPQNRKRVYSIMR